MKYAIVLLLGVSAWGQTPTPSVPAIDPNLIAPKCPTGQIAVGLRNADESVDWHCAPEERAKVWGTGNWKVAPDQSSQHAPPTPQWQKEYDTFKADCERSRGILEKLSGIEGFTCYYTPSQNFHNCVYRNGTSNSPNGQDTSEIYSCDEAIIELRGKWSQTIEHGVVYGTQLGRTHGEPSRATAFDFSFYKWCPTPHPWDPEQKEMCGWADDYPKLRAPKKPVHAPVSSDKR